MNLQKPILRTLAITASLTFATAALADIRVSFIEGAPKDTFRIENTGTCPVTGASIVIDLSTSQGGLIFDVTAAGQGVEVFQPFEVTQGAGSLANAPTVIDGQTQVLLDILTLAPSETIAFTIDVDDTLGQRAITVAESEIQGATATYTQGDTAVSATMTQQATAMIAAPKC